MFCPSCGTGNKDNAKFCCSCGTQLIQPVQEAEPQVSKSENMPVKSQPTTQDARMTRKKFYLHPQNEKMHKFIQINAKALYIIVFIMYFMHLAYISMQDDVIAVEFNIIGKMISVGSFKTILLVFCVVQELLVLFAHIKQNYICAIVLVATMIVHSFLFGAGIITIIWIPCAIFFAFQLYKFEKNYQNYCLNGEI